MNMKFVVLFGPPAVGKMAVGKALSEKTGIPLFHNHMSIEPVLPFFDFGTPAFARLVGNFRQSLFKEVAFSDLPGLIFTFVWSLQDKRDAAFLDGVCELFAQREADITLVELKASVEERLRRNKMPERLMEKPSKRNLAESESLLLQLDEVHQLNSSDGIPLPYNHIMIDSTHLSPGEVADQIIRMLGLPEQGS